ncbi:MAG TPA: hypothetical protein VJL58_00285 [Pyrinomonadaceae bacterium]|nr:hypothetical protein [Pyrinomonadaceae bacterium]
MKPTLITKPFLRFLGLAIFLTFSTLAAHAQADPKPAAACDTEALTALYNKFLFENRGALAERKAASATAKQYLSKYGECTAEHEKKITVFLKDWQVKHETAIDESKCIDAVDNTPAKASQLCAPYLARDPENLRAYLLLSLAGIKDTRAADKTATVKAARKALELIKAGKKVEHWVVGNSKDEAANTLEYYSAYLTMDARPVEAAASMLKFARSDTKYSKEPNTYYYLGQAVYKGEVRELVAEYNQKCPNHESTPECDAANAKVEAAIDRVIDAYARVIALSVDNPEYARIATTAKPELVRLYKERHDDSDAGLNKLVAEVLSKPIP